jgi:hypothetical protein
MDAIPQQAVPERGLCATSSAAGTDRDCAVAALLAASRDYFALAAHPLEAASTCAAAGRRR